MPFYLYNGAFLTEGGSFAIHQDCCCAPPAVNEQWKRCDNDADAAVVSPTHIAHDYAWLCIGGIWVKCYNSGVTASSATDPPYLLQPGSAPTSCMDLVGDPIYNGDPTGEACPFYVYEYVPATETWDISWTLYEYVPATETWDISWTLYEYVPTTETTTWNITPV